MKATLTTPLKPLVIIRLDNNLQVQFLGHFGALTVRWSAGVDQ
jgi:hypothetical protein